MSTSPTRNELLAALARTRSISAAAELLGISRREVLQRVMRDGVTCRDLDAAERKKADPR